MEIETAAVKRSNWIQRRWFDFRNGHSVYLSFALTFINFAVITFSLAVERIPVLKEWFPSMWSWALFFFCIYIPLAVIIGFLHLKKQVPKEQEQLMNSNPFAFKTSPGKEQLYNLPGTIIGYDLQLKSMEINNQIADAFKKIYGVEIKKWNKEDSDKIEWLKKIAVGLQRGEEIKSLTNESLSQQNPKEYYRKYVADDETKEIHKTLAKMIMAETPNSVCEFGCGTGKNLRMLNVDDKIGIDVSEEAIKIAKAKGVFAIVGDETELFKFPAGRFDVIFTVSVLDHIPNVEVIISEFKRVAKKAIFLLETNDVPFKFYYPHDYESYGFKNTGVKFESKKSEGGDGSIYCLYKLRVGVEK